jgi:hypothetical protein
MKAAAKADSMSVEDLIKHVAAGRLRMPGFQRAFRWEASDRRALLDSIYRGYPVGTLLLWKNPPNREAGNPIEGAPPLPPPGEVHFIVDGQQRITTLWDALGRKPSRGESRLVFNMATEEFQSRPLTRAEIEGISPEYSPGKDELPSIPLHLLLDATLLALWVPRSLSREDMGRYFELGKRIREYKLALYTVEDADTDLLRHVFDRINTTGKSMTRDEVFNAFLGSRISREGAVGLDLVNLRLQGLSFGRLDSSTILKVFEALRGEKIGRLDPHQIDVQQAETDLVRTADALQAAVEFLREQAGVPRAEICPYELPLIVLARFFSLHPRPCERSRILLRRWFWRGTIAERFGGASNSLQQHIDDLQKHGDEHEAVQALLRRTGSSSGVHLDVDWLADFSLRNALGKATICALLSKYPRHLATGERIELASLFHRGTPGLLWSIASGPNKVRKSTLASKLLHPQDQSNPRQLLLACDDEAALLSHGIDAACIKALRAGDFSCFLELRAEQLSSWIRAFFARYTELERDDAPPLAALSRRTA